MAIDAKPRKRIEAEVNRLRRILGRLEVERLDLEALADKKKRQAEEILQDIRTYEATLEENHEAVVSALKSEVAQLKKDLAEKDSEDEDA